MPKPDRTIMDWVENLYLRRARGRARMRWAERLEYTAEAGAGRLHLHSALRAASGNKSFAQEPLKCVVVRSDQVETVVVNLEPVEKPDAVVWIDRIPRRTSSTNSWARKPRRWVLDRFE